MRIYIKNFKIKNIYFLHVKFISYLGYYNPNGLLYPVWEIGPNLLYGDVTIAGEGLQNLGLCSFRRLVPTCYMETSPLPVKGCKI
jgi:hypothetical protein